MANSAANHLVSKDPTRRAHGQAPYSGVKKLLLAGHGAIKPVSRKMNSGFISVYTITFFHGFLKFVKT